MKYAKMVSAVVLGMACAQGVAQTPQSFPNRPVRMIVAFPAGSETDFFARLVAQKMSDTLHQPMVVDNRPGAGGTLASAIVARAAADGYTLLLHSMAYAVTPAIYSKLPYDTLRDFTGISQIAGVPNVLVVPPSLGVKSVRELIALAKQKPGQVTYGSAGVGSGMHLNGEQFRLAADIQVSHVPYKGGPDALTDAITGRINYVFSPIGIGLPLIRDRRLVALAISTASRSPVLPDVPTVAEAALPGFEFDTWYGLFAPAKTPRAVVARLSGDMISVLEQPNTRERITSRGAVPKPSTSEQFNRFVRDEMDKLGAVVKAAGIKVE